MFASQSSTHYSAILREEQFPHLTGLSDSRVVRKRLLLASYQEILPFCWSATHDFDTLFHLEHVLRKWDLQLKNDLSIQAPHKDSCV